MGWKLQPLSDFDCKVENVTCYETLDAGYQCLCRTSTGRVIPVNGTKCIDEDECATKNGGCHQNCFNSPGSFECGCNQGYRLARDMMTCDLLNVQPLVGGVEVNKANPPLMNESIVVWLGILSAVVGVLMVAALVVFFKRGLRRNRIIKQSASSLSREDLAPDSPEGSVISAEGSTIGQYIAHGAMYTDDYMSRSQMPAATANV